MEEFLFLDEIEKNNNQNKNSKKMNMKPLDLGIFRLRNSLFLGIFQGDCEVKGKDWLIDNQKYVPHKLHKIIQVNYYHLINKVD